MPLHTLATLWPWVVSVILVLLARRAIHRRKKYARFPPGPSPLPIVGNILDFPRTHLGREFSALSNKFGAFAMPHDSDVLHAPRLLPS